MVKERQRRKETTTTIDMGRCIYLGEDKSCTTARFGEDVWSLRTEFLWDSLLRYFFIVCRKGGKISEVSKSRTLKMNRCLEV
jgi:hypothetical protein